MLTNETFRILARHFGSAEHINVTFEAGACPATNGKSIILPDDLQAGGDSMLAAMLHECGHVAYTDFNVAEYYGAGQAALFQCLNCLEDVRIDAITAAKYPAAREFAQTALSLILAAQADNLKLEPVALQLTKSICIKAIDPNLDLATIYPPDVAERGETLAAEFIPQAIKAVSTREVEEALAAQLLKAITGALKPEDMKQGQGQQGGLQGARQAKEQAEQASNKAKAKLDEAKAKAEKSVNDAQQAYNKYKKARTARRTYETKAAKASMQARQQGRDPATDPETQRLAAKKAQAQQAEQQAADQVRAIRAAQQAQDSSQTVELYNAEQALQQAEQKERDAECAIQQALNEEFTPNGENIALTGFKSVDLEALRQLAPIRVTPNLSETIKDALTTKRDQRQLDETGHDINASALPEYQTIDPEQFFINSERRDYKTRVAVLVDCSGSMQDFEADRPDVRAALAVNALAATLDAAKQAIGQGAPADVAVYAFGDLPERIYSEIDQYTGRDQLAAKWEQARYNAGQGTQIIKAINKACADLKEHTDAERVLIVITDADIESEDMKQLRNEAITDGARVVFIGCQAKLNGSSRGDARKLFSRYNINSQTDAADILKRAFMDAIV